MVKGRDKSMVSDPVTDLENDCFQYGGTVLPAQLRPAVNALHARSGERLLMLAVLTDAINIFLKGTAERRLWSDTRNWIRGGSFGCHTISFENACDALGIDPDALRERLVRLKYGDRARQTPRGRSALMLKPPATSRGPVKVAAPARSRGSKRRSCARV
jgi:hypothetical protein